MAAFDFGLSSTQATPSQRGAKWGVELVRENGSKMPENGRKWTKCRANGRKTDPFLRTELCFQGARDHSPGCNKVKQNKPLAGMLAKKGVLTRYTPAWAQVTANKPLAGMFSGRSRKRWENDPVSTALPRLLTFDFRLSCRKG